MSFYSDMADVATEVLGEFKQGVVLLSHTTDSGTPLDVDAPWLGNTMTPVDYTLAATVKRVEQKYVDGSLIIATDDQITFAVPAITPGMSDTFTVDGRARVLKDLRPIPAAGTPVAYIAFVSA